MKAKGMLVIVLGICGMVFLTPPAQARSYSGQSDYINDKFLQKQRRILKYKEELGLNQKQIEKIEALKINLEKDMVLLDAKIEVVNIELRSVLSRDEADIKTVNDLIDQKSELEKSKGKALAAAYVNLKEVLTPEQRANLSTFREIYKGPYGEAAESGQ